MISTNRLPIAKMACKKKISSMSLVCICVIYNLIERKDLSKCDAKVLSVEV